MVFDPDSLEMFPKFLIGDSKNFCYSSSLSKICCRTFEDGEDGPLP